MTHADDAIHPLTSESAPIGLTKREYFAAVAMQGIMASPQNEYFDIKEVARQAVEISDALIAELNKPTP